MPAMQQTACDAETGKTMGAAEISDEDFRLLETVNNLRRVGQAISQVAA